MRKINKESRKKTVKRTVFLLFFIFSFLISDSYRPVKRNENNLLYKRKEDYKAVNIFHRLIYRITTCLSTHYKTYCFAFQKRRFYTVKAALLHRKTAAFAMPKRNYHFSTKLSLQKQGYFSAKS